MVDRVLTSGLEQEAARRIEVSLRFGGVLKTVVVERRACRMLDPDLDVEAIGLPARFPPARSFLAAPVASSTQCYGWLCLADKLGAEGFGDDDERVIVSLAAQMAVAHENARLYQELLSHAAELGQEVVERKRAAEALRESEERYRELFENANDIIYTLDLEGRFTSINKVGQRITGYTTSEALKLNLVEIVAPEYGEVARRMLGLALKEQSTAYEIDIIARDGQRVAVEASMRLIYRDAAPIGIQGIARDVTERKRLEAQFLQSQKMEAIGRLAGGVAHDFNNLLTAIIGYTQLALTHLDRPDLLAGELAQVRRAGERAGELTRRLLLFSRKEMLQPRVLELNNVVSEMKKMLRRLISEDIELITMLDPELGSVKADPGQVEQALVNLVVNAKDAMPEGGKLIIRTANVGVSDEIASLPSGQYVTLEVADNGCGMDSVTQSRIFEPFFTTKEQGKGTGLGLSTVNGMAEQTGGKIEVVSELGIGTTFRIYLPRVDSVSGPSGQRELSRLIPRGTGTVLLVEDEKFVRELAAIVLREQGYTVLEASNGEEALKLAEDRRHTGIDILVTDVVMPKLGGRELAARLAELVPDTKVLFVSAYLDETLGSPGVSSKATHSFLQKPFTPSSLATKVKEVLEGCIGYTLGGAGEAGYVQDPGC
jgi:PAS domain S-box-containing protein